MQDLKRRCLFSLSLAALLAIVTAAYGPESIEEEPSTRPPASDDKNGSRQRHAEPASLPQEVRSIPKEGRLAARPSAITGGGRRSAPGMHPLKIAEGRDGLIYIPAGYRDGDRAPVVLLLHGAGGNAQHGISLLRSVADSANLVLVAPDSRGRTWDIILGKYGPDVLFIEQTLAQTFSRYTVDPSHIAVGGFSDGASYALSLGLINGDLFTHVLAYSPGFMSPTRQEGEPRVYISHGTGDNVLPINSCSRRIVPQLLHAGYDVTYREFDGPHTVPPEIIRESLACFIEEKS
ncbi:MAG: alpha/beta hydrolase-fold protein [Chloroflexota bacterium]|nr:alpha/beta hydrolase-fold protein [Chloroflexota bacterium]